jgi:hypothetical protein
MQTKNGHLGHSLRPETPGSNSPARPNPHPQTPTFHKTRSKGSPALQKTIDKLQDTRNATTTNLDTIQGKTRVAFKDLHTTCTKLNEHYDDLHTHYHTLRQNVTDNTDNDIALGADEQHHIRLNDIESLALTTNMANSVTNSIQTFDGYNSHDPKLWFIKLEEYFRARRMPENTWLAAINGFLSDEGLYAIEDIPEPDRDTYAKLKDKIIGYYKLTPIAKINLSAELAKRFQLPDEPAETFINDVVKMSSG